VNVTVNGTPKTTSKNASIADLLRDLEMPLILVAVERNGQIVPKGSLETTRVAEGDVFEVVTLVGGG